MSTSETTAGSASKNADSVSNQPGQFHSRVAGDEPLTTKGHKPGVLVGNDAAPEFSAKTLPPGTAPASRTFAPNPVSETPSQALNPDNDRLHGKESTKTTASSTLGGATSADVHKGLGHPGQGQTSTELRHDGQHTSKKQGGLVGRGVEGMESGNMGVDTETQEWQRAGDKEEGVLAGQRSDKREPQPEGEI